MPWSQERLNQLFDRIDKNEPTWESARVERPEKRLAPNKQPLAASHRDNSQERFDREASVTNGNESKPQMPTGYFAQRNRLPNPPPPPQHANASAEQKFAGLAQTREKPSYFAGKTLPTAPQAANDGKRVARLLEQNAFEKSTASKINENPRMKAQECDKAPSLNRQHKP